MGRSRRHRALRRIRRRGREEPGRPGRDVDRVQRARGLRPGGAPGWHARAGHPRPGPRTPGQPRREPGTRRGHPRGPGGRLARGGRVGVQHRRRIPRVRGRRGPRGSRAPPCPGQRLVPRSPGARHLPGGVSRPGRGAREDGHPARGHGVDGQHLRLHRSEHVFARHRGSRPGQRAPRDSPRRRARPQDVLRLGGVARRPPPSRRALRPRLRSSAHLHHGERLRRGHCAWSRRAGSRRGPGRLPQRAHRTAGPRDRRRRATSADTSSGRCSTISSGRPATPSGSASCGSTSIATCAGSSRTAVGGCATSSQGRHSSTTTASSDRSLGAGRSDATAAGRTSSGGLRGRPPGTAAGRPGRCPRPR